MIINIIIVFIILIIIMIIMIIIIIMIIMIIIMIIMINIIIARLQPGPQTLPICITMSCEELQHHSQSQKLILNFVFN